jgi:prophage endopeptidase
MIPYRSLIQYAAAVLVGITIGATVNGWRLSAALAEQKAQHAAETTAIARAVSAAATDAIERQQQTQTDLARIDQHLTQELTNARAETDELRAAVAAGQRQLRIQATCPTTTTTSVRAATATTSVDDEPGATLTGNAEQHYWRLRDQITLVTNQVAGLQAYISSACMGGR